MIPRFSLVVAALAGLLPSAASATPYTFYVAGTVRDASNAAWASSALTVELGAFADGFTPSADNTGEWAANWTALATGYHDADTSELSAGASLADNTVFPSGTRLYLWIHDDLAGATPEHGLLTDASWTVATNAPEDFTPVSFTPGSGTVALVGAYDAAAAELQTTDNITPVITALSAAQSVPAGGAVTLSVTALRATAYQWYFGDQAISGATGGSYTFNAALRDAGAYTVVVSGAEGTATTSDPVALTVTAPATLVVGTLVSLDLSADLAGVTYFATGLPKGLTLNAKTGLLSGYVTGKAGASYTVTYGYKSGKTSVTLGAFTAAVQAFPAELVGSYEALLEDADGLPAGLVRLTVGSGAAFTGRIVAGPTGSRAFSGKLSAWSDDLSTVSLSGIAVTVAKNTAYYSLDLALGRSTRALAVTLREGGTASLAASAEATAFTTGENPGVKLAAYTGKTGSIPAWKGVYTSRLGIDSGNTLNASETRSYPVGSGYARGVVSAKGILALSGRLADGTVFTASLSPAAEAASYRLYAKPYSVAGGYLGGWIGVDQREADARYFSATPALFWNKTGGVAATAKNATYRDGFGPLGVDFRMETWTAPASGQNLSVVLGQDAAGFEFGVAGAGGDLTESQLAALPTALALSAKNKVSVALPLLAEDATASAKAWAKLWTTTVAPATGLFTGTFKVTDTVDGQTVTRTATYRGMLLQLPNGDTSAFGAGYFLLPSLTRGAAALTGSIDFTAP